MTQDFSDSLTEVGSITPDTAEVALSWHWTGPVMHWLAGSVAMVTTA